METAIEALQDRIIYLTGQIALTKKEDMYALTKIAVIDTWKREIKELMEAQTILSNCL